MKLPQILDGGALPQNLLIFFEFKKREQGPSLYVQAAPVRPSPLATGATLLGGCPGLLGGAAPKPPSGLPHD